jgi:hypothetical protein
MNGSGYVYTGARASCSYLVVDHIGSAKKIRSTRMGACVNETGKETPWGWASFSAAEKKIEKSEKSC